MKQMQEISTKVFITASLLFGATGIFMIVTAPEQEDPAEWLFKTMAVLVFIILSSFGVSVGLKYLSSDK